MTRTARWIVGVAALAMSAAYVLPLWSIGLIAPQYPEGLGMLIWINTIGGFKENDLNSINGLNHYIGMKEIVPDSIPELKWMPVILGVLIVTGLAVAWIGRRGPFYTWAVALGLVFVAGLADYAKWGYEYGHDLDPKAIIRVDGMSYQPPIVGSKQLLNFRATSWPASGGWVLVAAALAVAGVMTSTLRRRSQPAQATGKAGNAALAATALVGFLASCAPAGPRAIALNEDACTQCRMTIVDARFGGEAITTNGRTMTFDSVECLVNWARTAPAGTAKNIYVIDLQHPGTFVPAESAGFLRGALINSPMAGGIAAFASQDAAEQQRTMLGGTVVRWSDLLADTARASHIAHAQQ
ncbi:MAG: nitrous oxide reductase accessory protein NosL [Gemmatimonadota bacterium]|nr:nitrous oxide reductase accessory protein NosL [Gemmatimonadota bacterium]